MRSTMCPLKTTEFISSVILVPLFNCSKRELSLVIRRMRIFLRPAFKTNTEIFEVLKNTQIRHASDGKVRVRFAPSPTGFLHLGGLRTALYNHLFAKSQNGVSLLRIEDTDQTRIVENATESLINDLAWCGIVYDEAPVFQSKRINIYKEYVNQLLLQGDAYHCFCSSTRLNLLRKEAVKAGEIPKYDNKCRNLSKEEVQSKLDSGIPSCIRFKLTNFKENIHDIVYGDFQYDVAEYEGDLVIIKADGFPTYHFANVVDDHLMKITHVLRGIEWQISTPKHLLLYRAFGWTPPAFGHLPLLLNSDGTKLSKRFGDTQVQNFRKNGYLPEAVLNFITSFGGGFNLTSKEKDSRSYTLEELSEKFDVTKLKSSSCKISFDKLEDFNKLEIERLLGTEEGKIILTQSAKQIIRDHFKDSEEAENLNLHDDYIKTLILKIRHRISKLQDLVSKDFSFIWVWSNHWKEDDKQLIHCVKNFNSKITEYQSEWSEDSLKKLLKDFIKQNNIQTKSFMKSMRILLIGREEGPGIAEIMCLLGKDIVQNRLVVALNEKEDLTSNQTKGRILKN